MKAVMHLSLHLVLVVIAAAAARPTGARVHISKETSLASVRKFSQALHAMKDPSDPTGLALKRSDFCDIVTYGSGWGGKNMCNMTNYANHNSSTCHFMSFGISYDYSFDQDVKNQTKCKGLAFDPSQHYPSTMIDGVKFFEVGANVLPGVGDDYMAGESDMLMMNVPQFADSLGLSALEVLKMDCEGCEYALAGDVLKQNHRFFNNINQFAVEFHFSPFWVKNDDAVVELGKLLYLLELAELQLVSADLSICGPWSREEEPCNQLILDMELPCGVNWDPTRPNLRCHDLVFARKPDALVKT